MRQLLQHLIAAGDWQARLARLADGAPASAPLSLRLELPARHADWLAQVPEDAPFWYRARPAQGEFRLGIGHALHVASAGTNRFAALDNAHAGLCREWRHEGPALAFAGFAFEPEASGALPNALLAIPAILLECSAGRCSATLTITANRLPQATAEWLALLAHPARQTATLCLPARSETLAEQAWQARVKAALRDIEAGRVDKLVLSRSRRVEASRPFSIPAILASLLRDQPDSLIYVHGNGRQTFLGASPERLVSLNAGQIEADALAGTAWSGSPSLSGEKNRHEQSLVVGAIIDALAPLCRGTPQASPAEAHTAGHLSHLRSRIAGQALPGTRLFELIRAIHPTPAVGGFPTNAARQWLQAHGEQRSGWYSGGFGLLDSEGNGEFSVALRSALIDGQHAELQAGAGIVAGSDPELELAETEAKFATLIAALAPSTSGHDKACRHG